MFFLFIKTYPQGGYFIHKFFSDFFRKNMKQTIDLRKKIVLLIGQLLRDEFYA